MTVQFAPSVLSADFSNLGRDVRAAVDAGAPVVHFDVMDGQFVPNITFGPMVVKAVRGVSDALYETHLMIQAPENFVEEFARAGADRILVHPEVCPHLHRILQQIRDAGAEPGVALNPSTPLDCIKYVMDDIECILIMTVNPGFGGQKFIPAMYRKIAHARALADSTGRHIWIGVDGGINTETAPKVVEAGADLIIAGSSVFTGAGTVKENLAGLEGSIAGVVVAGG